MSFEPSITISFKNYSATYRASFLTSSSMYIKNNFNFDGTNYFKIPDNGPDKMGYLCVQLFDVFLSFLELGKSFNIKTFEESEYGIVKYWPNYVAIRQLAEFLNTPHILNVIKFAKHPSPTTKILDLNFVDFHFCKKWFGRESAEYKAVKDVVLKK